MRSEKGSRNISVRGVNYRWRATGNDGYVMIGIWPANNIGPFISGTLTYDEVQVDTSEGDHFLVQKQVVVTSRIIRRIIEHAITVEQYDPQVAGKEFNLRKLEGLIKWDDAIRAT